MLTLDELTKAVGDGSIDTVIVAFTDMQGRLMGKRLHGEFFVEEHVGRPLRIDYRWAGIFGMVFDFLPVVGRVPGADGLWIAGGYSGHGNVLGFACGRLVARAILDDSGLELIQAVDLDDAAAKAVLAAEGVPA